MRSRPWTHVALSLLPLARVAVFAAMNVAPVPEQNHTRRATLPTRFYDRANAKNRGQPTLSATSGKGIITLALKPGRLRIALALRKG